MSDRQLKAIFFDVRDTLGYVDRPGHLVTYKPSTSDLLKTVSESLGLRVGVITNLPRDVSSEMGRRMLEEADLIRFIDPQGIVTNHDAKIDKPDPRIYRYAAERMGLKPEECVFVGENFAEVLGAQIAGMQTQLKPCPPGREFLLKPIAARASTERDSGRLSEMIMEEEHIVGRRLVVAAATISQKLGDGAEPPLRAMGLLVYLLLEFIDRYHHAVEERVLLPLAYAFGYPPADAAYVYDDHEMGRSYFRALDTALKRIREGDETAIASFKTALEGFVMVYREHARRENDETLPNLGSYLNNYDDAVIVELMDRYGPGDLGPWLMLIADMERELGLPAGGT